MEIKKKFYLVTKAENWGIAGKILCIPLLCDWGESQASIPEHKRCVQRSQRQQAL